MKHSAFSRRSADCGAMIKSRAGALLVLVLMTSVAAHPQRADVGPQRQPAAAPDNGTYGSLDRAQQTLAAHKPVFIENKGQWDKQAKFLLRSPGLDLWITDNGVVYDLSRVERLEKPTDRTGPQFSSAEQPVESIRRDEPALKLTRTPVFITYEGASTSASAIGSGKQPEYHNYYIGNDRSKWAEHVALYSDARVRGLYSGIDAVFYLDNGRPRYDLVVAPGADPASIRMRVEGATSVGVAESGALRITTTVGTIEQRELFAYQEVEGRQQQVACAFVATDDGRVRLSVGAYDRSRPLVIDPIVYSTFLGGSGGEIGEAIAVDGNGDAYIAGFTSSTDFPTLNPAQGSLAQYTDAFVTKLASSGSIAYSTYLGGSGTDYGHGIAVNDSGNAFVTGETTTNDFPIQNGIQAYGGGYEAFVTKLTDSGALSVSTYLGGSGYEIGRGIAVDDSGYAYVTGPVTSTDFPTLDATQEEYGGGNSDAFVTKLSDDSLEIFFSTYLGGSGADQARGIAVGRNGDVYITGSTASTNFPTVDAAQDSLAGGLDAFVTKLNSDGNVSFSTYLGGPGTMTLAGNDQGFGVAVDSAGNAYVTGQTSSPSFPTVNAAQGSYGGGGGAGGPGDAFATKLTSGGAISYSTFLGGSSDDYGNGMAIDNGLWYITGSTSSTNFPTRFAIQASKPGPNSAFVTSLTSSGAILASTYLGGSSGAEGFGIAVDGSSDVYIAGKTSSSNFPTLNAAQGTNAGAGDAFVTKMSPGTGISNVSVSSPRCVGGSANISWYSVGVDSVNVDLSTDGGTTWTMVASDQSNGEVGGSYVWTVPDAPGSNRRVRVRSASDSSIVAVSAAFEILTAPTVTTEPVSNDPVCLGTWVSFNASAVGPNLGWRWQISTDDGESFTDLEIDWTIYGEESGAGSTVLWVFDPQPSMDGDQFRVIFTNGCLPDTTVAATLRIGAPAIAGRLFDDENGNCLRDAQEPGLSGRIIEVTPGPIYATTDSLGNYRVPVLPGTYSITSAPLYLNPTCPEDLPISVTLSDCGETSTGNDIAVRADSGIYDLRVSIVGNRIRPGLGSDYYLKYINVGTEATAGTLRLTYDSTNLTVVSSSAAADDSTSNTLEWSLATLQPGDHGTIRVTMLAHTTAPVGSEICGRADLDLPGQAIDETPLDNHDEVCVSVTRSFDPNDKAVSPVVDACGRLQADDTILAYQVRFQNTGSDTAFTVVIRDALDASLLDVSSLTIGAASHPYTWSIDVGNVLVIRFDDILLPDSNTSEPNSHGVVKYTLRLRQDLAPGTAIPNSAAIYFDFNDPVITNEVVSRTPDFFITEHPTDQLVVDGESATFSVAASGATSVQWQLSTDDGTSFDDIDGETSTYLVISSTTVTMDGYRYRAIVTNTCDSTTTDAATLYVEGDDMPPVPDVETLPELSAECTLTIGAAPTATASNGETVEGTTDDPLTYSDQGTYTVHWTYEDDNGNIASQEQTVIIDDVTAPTLSASVSPTSLWSPNATMRSIAISATADDNCNSATWVLTSISGDDGASSDDWSYTADTAPDSVQLRAERTGEGNGRTYTLSFTASDGHGNTAIATCYVAVPHDQSGKLVAGRSREVVAYGFNSEVVPNPFTASTDIRFTLPVDGLVTVRIYDLTGHQVAVLLRRDLKAGAHNVVWNGVRSDGSRTTAGQYLYRIESEGMSETGSMTLVR